MTHNLRFVREQALLDRMQLPRSTFRRQVATGLFSRPLKLSPRCAAWPDHEVHAILSARMTGASDDDVRKLVDKLHAQRAEAGAPA